MATPADIKNLADSLVAAEATLGTEVATLAGSIDNLATVVANLRANGSLSVTEQKSLDDAAQEITDASGALAGEVANLQREQGVADTAANPPQG